MDTPLTVRTVLSFERTFRTDSVREHAALFDMQGQLVAARDGDNDSVTFTAQELNSACLGLLTHTHALGKPPSGPDLVLAARYGLTLRAVGNTPDGEQWDYTVQMPATSGRVAELLAAHFDDALEAAKKELAPYAWNNFKWERESRHLAILRLAKHYGFAYQRTRLNAPLSETKSYEQTRLDTLSDLETTLRDDVFSPLLAGLVRGLTRLADHQGLVPVERLPMAKREAARQVQTIMLGSARQDALSPYHIQNGEVIPRSAYFKMLWSAMRRAASAAVERHADIMRKHLPDDLRRQFEMATLSPFETALHEIEGDELDPTLPHYDPLHQWIGIDGKGLSDRIWGATGDMRRKLDAYLTEAIAARKPISVMAQELEAFVLDGYGSYEARRLARTEVAAASARADSVAAQLDPFVDTYSFFVAPSHECCDKCDDVQDGNPYHKDDTKHLPPRHPNCVCGIVWNIVSDVQGVVDWIRQQVNAGLVGAKKAIADFIGPLSKRFIDVLFRGWGQ